MDARYVFAVRFRLEPDVSGVSLEPQEFETRLFRRADPPGEDGWRFFRDNLWRGDVGDERYFRKLTSEALGVPVTNVEYRAFETDEEYYDALKAEIAAGLATFKADSVSEVISKYLGSSVEVER
ncbi:MULTISPECIES: LWR-salt protein [unclassified Haladaptatus]|uniref:LWR-salt protein n=1 Tax=unclassified Haladaptatus TaxID=2622732 RepID=UPI00209C4F0A|nr:MULTISPECIES: LWR-salt protein [unclassified Haladaptatus]MCO8242921.1 LWR-salt protein [Haladaptatus sp. AB643]MCO8252678.1 LWR-salt protein [Haladaptatus sp. AB618]